MPGYISNQNEWEENTLFAVPRPPIERPHAPWRHNAKETSQKAGEAALGRSGSQRRRIYDEVFLAGSQGMTSDEIGDKLKLPPQSVSARVNGLHNDGHLVDSGQRRHTKWGIDAIVWVAK
jgi:hypothetical protein